MKSIAEISFENRIHVQTLYQRIKSRKVPVRVIEGRYMVGEEYLEVLLAPGVRGRRVKLDKKE